MAEVIGIVSGGITFATVIVQIGKAIISIKGCYDDLQDAPGDLRKLVEKVELMGFILADIENDLIQNPNLALENSRTMLPSLILCEKAASDLDGVCTEIVRETNPRNRLRRSFKPVKMIMQKGKIEKCLKHLQDVIQLLMLSQQHYTKVLLRAQPQIIIERITQHDQICSSSENSSPARALKDTKSDTNLTAAPALSDKRLRLAQNSSHRWRLSLPWWITSQVLEVAGVKAPGGWNWHLRAYNVIPYDSLAIKFVENGDIQGIQDLFTSGQASPFDQIDVPPKYGRSTLLYWVGRTNRTEMISFLLDQGTDPNSLECLPLYEPQWFRPNYTEFESLIPSMRLLIPHIDLGDQSTEEAANSVFGDFQGTVEEFLFLQQHLFPSFFQLSKQSRIQLVISIFLLPFAVHHDTANICRTIIGTDVLEADDFKFCAILGSTLIHCAATNLGFIQRHNRPSKISQLILSSYATFKGLCYDFLCIVGLDIHHLDDGFTPFLSFLSGLFSILPREDHIYQTRVRVWLELLEAAGVDLNEYGKAEEHVWKTEITWRGWTYTARIIGFAYGPSPKDWHVWVTEISDSFVGEFWAMIERPVEVMPGAWPME